MIRRDDTELSSGGRETLAEPTALDFILCRVLEQWQNALRESGRSGDESLADAARLIPLTFLAIGALRRLGAEMLVDAEFGNWRQWPGLSFFKSRPLERVCKRCIDAGWINLDEHGFVFQITDQGRGRVLQYGGGTISTWRPSAGWNESPSSISAAQWLERTTMGDPFILKPIDAAARRFGCMDVMLFRRELVDEARWLAWQKAFYPCTVLPDMEKVW